MIADLHRLVTMLDQLKLDEIAHQLAHIYAALAVLICVISALTCVSAIRLGIAIQEWRYANMASRSSGGSLPSNAVWSDPAGDNWDG